MLQGEAEEATALIGRDNGGLGSLSTTDLSPGISWNLFMFTVNLRAQAHHDKSVLQSVYRLILFIPFFAAAAAADDDHDDDDDDIQQLLL